MISGELISVIVPVYRVETYLDRCVQSIVSQTYQNLEIILVDDGSPDRCPAMCDAWAEKDSRICVIHKENGGLSDARNAGMAAAAGEYISFVDSDDIVLDCFLQSLVDAVSEDNQIDMAYCGYAIVESSVSLKTYRSATYIGAAQIHDVLSQTNLLYRCSPWAKLFRRSIIVDNGLRFDEFQSEFLEAVKGIENRYCKN